jgi:hypothetical protein
MPTAAAAALCIRVYLLRAHTKEARRIHLRKEISMRLCAQGWIKSRCSGRKRIIVLLFGHTRHILYVLFSAGRR